MARKTRKSRSSGAKRTAAAAAKPPLRLDTGNRFERWGRFTHFHNHTTGHRIGDYSIAYWRLGDVKLLPESCCEEAGAKGYKFLGWAAA